jgi:NTE family protein
MSGTVGLALGGGGARGWAHIGVLRGLAEMGIAVDAVAGASIGACVGAAYLTDQLETLENWARSMGLIGIVGLIDITFRRGGLVLPHKAFERFHTEIDIEALPKPFAAVACELGTGREVWLRRGPLLTAVQASAALPGLFPAVARDGRWLVDGALVNPVPVSVVRAMEAEVVIAVNLNGEIAALPGPVEAPPRDKPTLAQMLQQAAARFGRKPDERARFFASQVAGEPHNYPNALEVIAGSLDIMQNRITRARLAGEPPDVLIAPRLGHIGVLEFDRAEEAVALGYDAVRIARPSIELALKRL